MSDEDLAQFVALTNAPEDSARAFLQKHGNLEASINRWLDNGGEDSIEEEEVKDTNSRLAQEEPGTPTSEPEKNVNKSLFDDRITKVMILIELCNDHHCPIEITREIGSQFVYVAGTWNPFHCSETIKIEGNRITKLTTGWSNVLGIFPGSYKVQIAKKADGFMMIGLAPNTTNKEGENSEKCGYYLYTSDLSLWAQNINRQDYGSNYHDFNPSHGQLTDGQIIEVIYKNNSIRYVIDGIDCGIAFENLPQDQILYPSIDFYYSNCSLDFIL